MLILCMNVRDCWSHRRPTNFLFSISSKVFEAHSICLSVRTCKSRLLSRLETSNLAERLLYTTRCGILFQVLHATPTNLPLMSNMRLLCIELCRVSYSRAHLLLAQHSLSFCQQGKALYIYFMIYQVKQRVRLVWGLSKTWNPPQMKLHTVVSIRLDSPRFVQLG